MCQVLLCSVHPGLAGQQQAEDQINGVCEHHWLLKITSTAPEAQQVRAANAIGAQIVLEPNFCCLYDWPDMG